MTGGGYIIREVCKPLISRKDPVAPSTQENRGISSPGGFVMAGVYFSHGRRRAGHILLGLLRDLAPSSCWLGDSEKKHLGRTNIFRIPMLQLCASPGRSAFGEKPPGNLMRPDAPVAEASPQSHNLSRPL